MLDIIISAINQFYDKLSHGKLCMTNITYNLREYLDDSEASPMLNRVTHFTTTFL